MKERPILFSAPMVRAILENRKTQTRRIVMPQPEYFSPPDVPRRTIAPGVHPYIACQYGSPGDRLWVRETFMPIPMEVAPDRPRTTNWNIVYGAGGQAEMTALAEYNPMLYNYERWSPSIHMPRWASRISLEITGIRIEKLQDISEADALSEGADHNGECDHARRSCEETGCFGRNSYRGGYAKLWESINGHGAWDANPWVWVVEFCRIGGAQ